MRRLWLLAPVSAAAAIAACIIGPKQDDPASPAATVSDTGVFEPVDARSPEDTFTDPAAATEGGTDTNPGLVADAASDSAGDACPDGGVPLTGYGPWNGGNECWKSALVFECVTAIDGGAAWTCFAQISTGELFLAPSTHIPSGSDYRSCNDAERMRVKWSPELCK